MLLLLLMMSIRPDVTQLAIVSCSRAGKGEVVDDEGWKHQIKGAGRRQSDDGNVGQIIIISDIIHAASRAQADNWVVIRMLSGDILGHHDEIAKKCSAIRTSSHQI